MEGVKSHSLNPLFLRFYISPLFVHILLFPLGYAVIRFWSGIV
jgi:hypothetical protein